MEGPKSSMKGSGRGTRRLALVMNQKLISVLRGLGKGRCTSVIRSKTDWLKARLLVTTAGLAASSMKKKLTSKFFSSNSSSKNISNCCSEDHDTTSGSVVDIDHDHDREKEIFMINNNTINQQCNIINDEEEDDKYPDLRHSLFDDEEEEELENLLVCDPNINALSLAVMPSVIDLVKSSREVNEESFNLEDEIDEVADLFITKFHKRMRLQKLLSFKRYQEMLNN